MKKHYIFSLCLCFLCTTFSFRLSAQEYNNFDLNKYYTPDIVRNAGWQGKRRRPTRRGDKR